MPRKYDFGFPIHKCLRLSRVEEILRDVIEPIPSRDALVGLIEDGTVEGVKTSCGWVFYEDSFREWVRSFQPQSQIQTSKRPKLRIAARA